eukprot:scaffold150094_cov38-Prasinocladus_malaysianus.AAC.1
MNSYNGVNEADVILADGATATCIYRLRKASEKHKQRPTFMRRSPNTDEIEQTFISVKPSATDSSVPGALNLESSSGYSLIYTRQWTAISNRHIISYDLRAYGQLPRTNRRCRWARGGYFSVQTAAPMMPGGGFI